MSSVESQAQKRSLVALSERQDRRSKRLNTLESKKSLGAIAPSDGKLSLNWKGIPTIHPTVLKVTLKKSFTGKPR